MWWGRWWWRGWRRWWRRWYRWSWGRWFGAALTRTKVGPNPLPPQVEPLLLPVEPLLARPDLPGLALHHDGGLAFPLHPVDPPHFIHLAFQWLCEAASEVEGEVLVRFLTPLPPMTLGHMVKHPAGAASPSPLLPPPPLPEEGAVVAAVPLKAEGQGAMGLATVHPVLQLLLLHLAASCSLRQMVQVAR